MRASATPAWTSTSGGPSPSAHQARRAPATSVMPLSDMAGHATGRRLATSVCVAVLAVLMIAPAALACDVRKVARAHKDPSRAVRAPLIVGDSTMLLATPYLGA